MSDERFEVRDEPENHRYALIDLAEDRVAGEEVYVDVDAGDHTERVLVHTGVEDAYEGQGLASRLVGDVVNDIVGSGNRIVPVCPYVVKWLERHTEFAEHVVKPTPEHLKAAGVGGN